MVGNADQCKQRAGQTQAAAGLARMCAPILLVAMSSLSLTVTNGPSWTRTDTKLDAVSLQAGCTCDAGWLSPRRAFPVDWRPVRYRKMQASALDPRARSAKQGRALALAWRCGLAGTAHATGRDPRRAVTVSTNHSAH